MADILSQLKVIIGLEAKGFAGVQSQMRGFTNGIQNQFANLKTAVAGYFTTHFAVELGKSVAHMAERWKDLSEQTGESTDEIQKFDAAFKKVGLTAEDAARAFDVLAQKRDEALKPGGGGAASIFQGLGLSEKDIAGKRGAELFRMVSGLANEPGNQAARSVFAQLFGTKRSGKLLAGASEIAKGGGGPIMSAESIRVLDDASKQFARAVLDFKVAVSPLVAKVVSGTGNALEGLSNFNLMTLPKQIWQALTGTIPINAEHHARSKPSAAVHQSTKRAGRMGWQMDEARQGLFSALDATVLKAANPMQKRGMLQAAMNRDMQEARRQEGLGNYAAADALRAGVIKQAGDLAALSQGGGSSLMKRDSLAAVGGFVGGASMGMDPSLTIQQEQLNVLRQILQQYPELIDALTGKRLSPISQIR